MVIIELFIEFFKIGLLAIGGGMATIPFLQHLSEVKGWYDTAFIADMIAISESTPGPIGINMSTYVGFKMGGVFGAIIATLAMIIPSIIIVSIVAIYLKRFKDSIWVESAFYGIRPAVTALIAAACFEILKIALVLKDTLYVQGIVLFAIAYVAIRKFKWHPVVYIALSALIGIVLKL